MARSSRSRRPPRMRDGIQRLLKPWSNELTEARKPPAHDRQAGSISSLPTVPPPTNWTRVREHKVVQWLLAYAAAAYTLLHIVEMVGAALDWPHVVARIVTLGLFLGIPLVATLAWYHGHRALRWVSGAELAILTVLLFIAGGVLWYMGRATVEHTSDRPVADAPAPVGSSAPLVGAPPERSIAVLPFLDMSEKKDQEYFADGMAEEVIDLLTKIPDLRVVGRTSSFSFKGRPDDLRSIGEKLGASYVVEGSVRRADNRVRVTAQLIDAHSGTHLWSETYDHDFSDVLAMQDQIARGIARALQLAVGADIREVPHLQDTEAYTFYLRGRSAIDRGDAGVGEAKIYLEQSLLLDPTFVRAAEALALAYVDEIAGRVTSSQAGWPAAVDAAQRALRLDRNSAMAHAVLGLEGATYAYDWQRASSELDATLALKPRDPYALFVAAWLAFDLGRQAEALRLQDASIALDPLNPDSHQNGAYIRYMMGDLNAAERGFRRSIEISPTFESNHRMIGEILLQRHEPKLDLDQAFQWLVRAVSSRDINLGIASSTIRYLTRC